jgi:putative tricarboxylic transport membrane protein
MAEGAEDVHNKAVIPETPGFFVDTRLFLAISGVLIGLVFGWVSRPSIPVIGIQIPFGDFISSLFSNTGLLREIVSQTATHVALFVVGTVLVTTTIGFVLAQAGFSTIDLSAIYVAYKKYVRGPRDFFGGVALIVVAGIALWASSSLPGQQGFAFGPGTAPRIFAGLLMAVGVLIALTGLFVKGPPIESFAVRGPAYVLLAILVFAATIRGIRVDLAGIPLHLPAFGMVFSTFVAFMVSLFGSTEFRLVESLIAAVAMTIFCVVLFVYLLQLPFQLWPMF